MLKSSEYDKCRWIFIDGLEKHTFNDVPLGFKKWISGRFSRTKFEVIVNHGAVETIRWKKVSCRSEN